MFEIECQSLLYTIVAMISFHPEDTFKCTLLRWILSNCDHFLTRLSSVYHHPKLFSEWSNWSSWLIALVLYWLSVRLGAATTAFLHKLQKGIPPWVPLKGHEEKTYKQLQQEAIESKRRDLAVLKANDGIWHGVRIPSHALFLWASGFEVTTLLDSDHMPNKYIWKVLRYFFF